MTDGAVDPTSIPRSCARAGVAKETAANAAVVANALRKDSEARIKSLFLIVVGSGLR